MIGEGPNMVECKEEGVPPSLAREDERSLFLIWQKNSNATREERIWSTVERWSSRPYEDFREAFQRLGMDHRQILGEMAQMTCEEPELLARNRLDVLRLVKDEIAASAQSSFNGDKFHRALVMLRECLSDVRGPILALVSDELLSARII